MKTLRTLFVIAIAILGLTTTSLGQSATTASTSAKLLTPLAITKTTDLNFGTFAASSTAGTVVLDYVNGRTKTGGIKLLTGESLEKTAVFTVSGEAGTTFSITINDPSEELAMSGPTSGMTVTGFTAQEGSNATLESGTGLKTMPIHVKATLKVPADAAAGDYTNASGLHISVDYN